MNLRTSNLVWLAVIVAIGLNLRPLLTSISPLMGAILPATGLSFRGASMLTGLPVVTMGVCAFGASALTRAIGNACGVAIGLVAIVVACAGRLFAGNAAALIASAAIAGTDVAIIQALLPGVMKARFAARLLLRHGPLLRIDHGRRRARREHHAGRGVASRVSCGRRRSRFGRCRRSSRWPSG